MIKLYWFYFIRKILININIIDKLIQDKKEDVYY